MKRKVMMVIVGSALLAGFCFSCGTANHNARSVSLMQLIVNPEKYHGKLVRVIGVSRIEFEGDSIWFTKEHYQHGVSMNSLWIEPDYNALGTTRQQLEQFNGKYVLIEGVFNKDNHGHLGMYSGSLEKITRFQLWEEEETSQPMDAPMPTKETNPTNLPSPIPTKTTQNDTRADINQDDQAIYSLFMDDSNGKIIIIREDTFTDTFPQSEDEAKNYIKSNLQNVSSETLDNYLYVNSFTSKLPSNMSLGVNYILISTPEFVEITGSSGWRDIWMQKYPNSEVSCIAFSRIGFNNLHTQALIYVTRLWVDGGYYLLELDAHKGLWEIIESFSNVTIN